MLGSYLAFWQAQQAVTSYITFRVNGPHAVPVLARYVFDPVIALLTGVIVGALAKYSPALLVMVSLVPSEVVPLMNRRLGGAHLLLMVFPAIFSLVIAAAVASLTFRARIRSVQTAAVRI